MLHFRELMEKLKDFISYNSDIHNKKKITPF